MVRSGGRKKRRRKGKGKEEGEEKREKGKRVAKGKEEEETRRGMMMQSVWSCPRFLLPFFCNLSRLRWLFFSLPSPSLPLTLSHSLTHFSAIALLFPFFGFPFSPAFFPQPFTAPTCSVPRRGREQTGTNKRRKEQGGKEYLSPHRTPFGISSSIPPELNNSNQQAKPHTSLPSYVMHASRVKEQVTHASMTTRKKNSIG